ncbi:MAG: hypothetical protein P4L82_12945 [Ancalomicrobiaceae bacterium]|nr:hypothetical protein [Ancalomicrobiaceae bacterium]
MTDDDAVRLRRSNSVAQGPFAQDPFARGRLVRGRLGRIVGAYLAACLVAAVVLPILFLIGDMVAGRSLAIRAGDWLVLPAGLFVVTVVAAAPFATLAIVLTEGFRLAAPIPYLAAGGVIGLGVEVVVHWLPVLKPDVQPADIVIYGIVAVVGMLAGFAYWLIAVRHRRIAAAR